MERRTLKALRSSVPTDANKAIKPKAEFQTLMRISTDMARRHFLAMAPATFLFLADHTAKADTPHNGTASCEEPSLRIPIYPSPNSAGYIMISGFCDPKDIFTGVRAAWKVSNAVPIVNQESFVSYTQEVSIGDANGQFSVGTASVSTAKGPRYAAMLGANKAYTRLPGFRIKPGDEVRIDISRIKGGYEFTIDNRSSSSSFSAISQNAHENTGGSMVSWTVHRASDAPAFFSSFSPERKITFADASANNGSIPLGSRNVRLIGIFMEGQSIDAKGNAVLGPVGTLSYVPPGGTEFSVLCRADSGMQL